MKRTVYDYRGFSLKKLNEPRFAHLKLLGGWIVYFALYFITENLIPWERCTPIHCGLDDLIPFNEWFALFYVGWYALVFGSLLYTLLFDVPRFRKIQIFIMITQAVAMLIYILWPSRQDLRPEVFSRQNFLTWVMGIIYAFDTNTGVCPSLHVAYSIGIASVWLRQKEVRPVWRGLIALLCALISISTAFVKQHSVLDILAALPLGLLAEVLVYGRWWKERLGKKKT